MHWLGVTLWGAFGGCAMEALDYVTSVRRYRRLPWYRVKPTDPGPLAYGIASVLRIALGAGVACAVATAPQSPVAAWYAMGLGAAAPVVLEKLTLIIPLVLRTAVNDSPAPTWSEGGQTMTVTHPVEPVLDPQSPEQGRS
ncbi:hypothetical protein [Streptomyces sp. BK340]|uniref:hypothetical protein n=1 Tax=Streptomyces sp. BK340 TaxID=2572903 RepID=UPI0011AAE327|nr:hypothetical protein [Streptomyces sp. BK340]TVZ78035.1 hypothetical protein FB157_13659 [Streptomyces sp. BK340]